MALSATDRRRAKNNVLKRRALSEREHLVNANCGYGARLLNTMLTVLKRARSYSVKFQTAHRIAQTVPERLKLAQDFSPLLISSSKYVTLRLRPPTSAAQHPINVDRNPNGASRSARRLDDANRGDEGNEEAALAIV